MAPNEPFLRKFLCSNCHAAILEIHPEEKFALQEFYKCNICGFTKQIKKTKSKHDRVVHGRRK